MTGAMTPVRRIRQRVARAARGPGFRFAPSGLRLLVVLFLYLRTGGLVLFQVGTAFVTPTEGQLYDPIDGAVTVPTVDPDLP